MNDIRIAAVICNAPVNRVKRNLAHMAEWAAEAGRKGVDLLCFPELNVSGYSTRVDLSRSAEAIPGPITEAIAAMARDCGVTILAGLAERGTGRRVHASHVAVSPTGFLGTYRKVWPRPRHRCSAPATRCPFFR
jgi:N-carbamoylputrescine amidase